MKTYNENDYEERSILVDHLINAQFKRSCRVLTVIYSTLIAVTVLPSLFVHLETLSRMIHFLLGYGYLSALYWCMLVVAIDKSVLFPKHEGGNYAEQLAAAERSYRRNKIKIYVSVPPAFVMAFACNLYADHYIFECKKVFVEPKAEIFHLVDFCPEMTDRHDLKIMKGYEAVDSGYMMCPLCGDLWNQ